MYVCIHLSLDIVDSCLHLCVHYLLFIHCSPCIIHSVIYHTIMYLSFVYSEIFIIYYLSFITYERDLGRAGATTTCHYLPLIRVTICTTAKTNPLTRQATAHSADPPWYAILTLFTLSSPSSIFLK